MTPLITDIEGATMAKSGCLSSGQARRVFGLATITEAEHNKPVST
jgi:hypothetical protein